MPISSQSFVFAPPPLPSSSRLLISPASLLQPSPKISLRAKAPPTFLRTALRWRCRKRSNRFRGSADEKRVLSARSDLSPANKRKIIEHVFLLKARPDLSDVEEKDMLDYLYTTQYQMSGILAISLGRVEDPNVDNFTHAVYMRFQKKEDLAKFYVNSYYLGVLKKHVIPYCYGLKSVDYESEVEDDIMAIFRRGEEFNYGVEWVLLISGSNTASGYDVKDAVDTLWNLILRKHSLIVQATQGKNFNTTDSEYTHAAIIRFPSVEAFELFRGSRGYMDIWRTKFQPIAKKILVIHYAVDPVATELM